MYKKGKGIHSSQIFETQTSKQINVFPNNNISSFQAKKESINLVMIYERDHKGIINFIKTLFEIELKRCRTIAEKKPTSHYYII